MDGTTYDIDEMKYKIGQLVKINGGVYEIKYISSYPYLMFEDGSCHYEIRIWNVNGDVQDFIILNDAQLDICGVLIENVKKEV